MKRKVWTFNEYKERIDTVECLVKDPYRAQRMARRRYEYYRSLIEASDLDEKTIRHRIIEALNYYSALENRLVDRMISQTRQLLDRLDRQYPK